MWSRGIGMNRVSVSTQTQVSELEVKKVVQCIPTEKLSVILTVLSSNRPSVSVNASAAQDVSVRGSMYHMLSPKLEVLNVAQDFLSYGILTYSTLMRDPRDGSQQK